MRNFLLIAFLCFFCSTGFSQTIEKNWLFQKVENQKDTSFVKLAPNQDYLNLDNGRFEYGLQTKDSIKASGDYIYQNNLLVFFHDTPKSTIRRYRVETLTDSSLVFSKNQETYSFKSRRNDELITATTSDTSTITKDTDEIIPAQGFSLNSLWRGIVGMVSLIFIAFLFSSNRKAINWKTVGIGLALQLIIAIGVLKISFIQSIFEAIGNVFISILEYTQAGSKFLFEGLVVDMDTFGFIFAFQVLPTIIFFSALTSVLFYLGIIQKLVRALAWLLSKVLKISGAESLSVAGNIFLGQTEAPLLIKAYLEKMNKSEILLVMIGGMATVAGAVLAAYIGFLGGDDPLLRLTFAKHLLAASVMAAPGAIVISKILYPQTEIVNTDAKVSSEKIGSNLLDSIANGTTEGLRLAVNVGAMLLVFVAMIALVNGILGGLAGFDGFTIDSLNIAWHFTSLNEVIAMHTPYDNLSLEFILGYLFAPLMWLIGVSSEDMMLMGQLLGIKLAASEFVGYIQLADLKNVTNDLHLKYEKSIIMATYMLCGFANFASIGIQIGGIGSLAPGQRKQLSRFGMKALIGGTIASLISATIAGMIIG
ncbi:MAG: Na+ dependent nucleoside transporter [Flavobacteriaceae bacterium]|jgi:CNT family concentrative nucleoside transporter|nr:Na+ dependent nucleoside transporter [Flavobacteriaceae bacterium]|tara:strand:- start:14749 stop:16524 length:1776 start_codon:yes stop_codon:yes gene_type:complete